MGIRLPEARLPLSAPLSASPILFGYRHAEHAAENYVLLTGEMAALQRASCSDVTLLREIPRSEWETCGFYIEEWDGQQVVAQKFSKTAKLLDDEKKARTLARDAEAGTVQSMEERMAALEAQNGRLMALLERSNSVIAEQAEANARQQEREELEVLAEIEPVAQPEAVPEPASQSYVPPKPKPATRKVPVKPTRKRPPDKAA